MLRFAPGSLLVVLAAGCSGGGSAVTPTQACTDLASALCTKTDSCSHFGVQLVYGDVTTCEARAMLSCTPSLTAKGSHFTPAQYDSCANSFSSITCDTLGGNDPPAACQPPAGDQADGLACGEDSQCKSQYCRKSSGIYCGVCGSRSAAGGPCSVNADCAYGLVCGNGSCVTPAAAGATCDDAHPCQPTLACKGGACVVRAGAGATCDTLAQDCDSRQGLYCNGSKVCAALMAAAPGQPCGLVNQALVVCSGGGKCKGGGVGAMGTCIAPAADGAPCDANTPCLAPASCINGLCKLPDPASCT